MAVRVTTGKLAVVRETNGGMKLTVNSYSGFKANERPLLFALDGHEYQVEQMLDQWYGPDSAYFKVQASDGNLYILKYQQSSDEWSLESYRRGTTETGDMPSDLPTDHPI